MTKQAMIPCPFCGSPGEIAHSWTQSKSMTPRCSNYECIMHIQEQDEQGGFPVDFRKEADAIAVWNRRAKPE